MSLSRRGAIVTLLAAATEAAAAAVHASGGAPGLDTPQPFSFERLKARVAAMATQPFKAPAPALESLTALDFDAMGQIRYRSDAALWKDRPGGAVEFFHLGRYARTPVAIHVVEQGQARRVIYSEALFDILAGAARDHFRPTWVSPDSV